MNTPILGYDERLPLYQRLREEMQIEFVVADGVLSIIDAIRVQRSSRAAVRIAVALARDGIIPPDQALMRVQPRALAELLHHQVDPRAPRDLITRGMAASPGAATGRIGHDDLDRPAGVVVGLSRCGKSKRCRRDGDPLGQLVH